MDGLSAAASVITVIDASVKIASLCFQYSKDVKNAKEDIERLQRKVADIRTVLEKLNRERHGENRLSVTQKVSESLKACLALLEQLQAQLEPGEPGKARKAMQRYGARALKWPFTSRKVERIIADLENYEQAFSLALLVDQTDLLLDFDQKADLAKLPTASGASFDSHSEEHNAKCLIGTRIELQDHIIKWAENRSDKPVFWLNGLAGTGKSTVARTMAQSFSDKGQLGASFFFRKGEGDRGNASKFFTTIARDLALRVPGMNSGLRKAIDADPTIFEKALKSQFNELILQPLSEAKSASSQNREFIVVVDALDECEREEDIRAILELLAQSRNTSVVSLRVFVTSRRELPLRLGFKKMSDGTYQDFVLHEVAKGTIEHDIAVFLRHELVEIRNQRSLPSHWPAEVDIQTLVQMAVPLFIFAATACRYIGDKRDNPQERLKTILRYQARQISQLDKTYLPILQQLFDDDEEMNETRAKKFQKIIGSIIILEKPLSTKSLAYLLKIPKEDINCSLDLLHSVLSIPVNEDMSIRLLHLSFRDFLLDPRKRGKSPYWIDKRKAHKRLVEGCLQLASGANGLKQNMCNLPSPGTSRSEISNSMIDKHLPSEIRYACRYWTRHLQMSEWYICDGDQVHMFLQKYILYWLEAMILIGETSESIHMITDLESLTVPDKSISLSAFLQDVKRLVLQVRPILEDAPLQLYSSALVFAPEKSLIRKSYSSHIPGWIGRLPKVREDWNGLLQVLEGHSSWVTAVVFSPDSKLMVSASEDLTVRLWDTVTGLCNNTLEGHSGEINTVSFSPDGKLIASGSDDYTILLWETATGICRNILEGHLDKISATSFSPDNKFIASISFDDTLRLWDIATAACYNILESCPDWINATVAFSPDGKHVAFASKAYTVQLWDITTRSYGNTFKGHSRMIRAITFSPDGKLIVSGSDDGTVRLWNITRGSCSNILESFSGYTNALNFSPDNELLAMASNITAVRLWDITAESCSKLFKDHSDPVKVMVFSPDGKLVASASDDIARLWDTATGSCRNILKRNVSPFPLRLKMAFSPDNKRLALISNDHTLQLWDTITGSCRSTIQLDAHDHYNQENYAIAFSPSGKLIALISFPSIVRLWNIATGSCCGRFEFSQYNKYNYIVALAFSPDGKLVASASPYGTVRLWDTATGSYRSTLKCYSARFLTEIAFSPDGRYLRTDREYLPLPNTDSFQTHKPSDNIINNGWISLPEQRLLWLPHEYRPERSAIYDNIVCLACSSGNVIFLEFHLGKEPWHGEIKSSYPISSSSIN